MSKTYEIDELTLLFREVFGEGKGKDALDVLRRRFQKPAILPTQVGDGNAIVPLTLCRVGEDNVIRYIDNLLEREISNG